MEWFLHGHDLCLYDVYDDRLNGWAFIRGFISAYILFLSDGFSKTRITSDHVQHLDLHPYIRFTTRGED